MPAWTAADSTEENQQMSQSATDAMLPPMSTTKRTNLIIDLLFFLAFLRSAIQTAQQALLRAYEDPATFATSLFTEQAPINSTVGRIYSQLGFVHSAAGDYARLLIEEVRG